MWQHSQSFVDSKLLDTQGVLELESLDVVQVIDLNACAVVWYSLGVCDRNSCCFRANY